MKKLALALCLIFLPTLVMGQALISNGVVYYSFQVANPAGATAGTAYAMPSTNSSVITWQITFGTAPSAVSLSLQGSLDNSSWFAMDNSTNTAGEIRNYGPTSARFIRIYQDSRTGGSDVTVSIVVGRSVSIGQTLSQTISGITSRVTFGTHTITVPAPYGYLGNPVTDFSSIHTTTNLVNNEFGGFQSVSWNPAAASSAYKIGGFRFSEKTGNTNTTGTVIGGWDSVVNTGSGTLSELLGNFTEANHNGTGNMSDITAINGSVYTNGPADFVNGVYGLLTLDTSSVTGEASGLVGYIGGGGDATAVYGAWVSSAALDTGTTPNVYGYYVDTLQASGNKWAFYTNDAALPSNFKGNIKMGDAAAPAKPACSATTRGFYWHVYGGAGVKDTVEVCAKDAADAYAWRTIY